MSDQLSYHNDAAGLVQSAEQASGPLPYLGDLHDVDQILRKLNENVINRFAAVGRGQMSQQEAAEADQAECIRLGEVFDGQDLGYNSIEHWNGNGLANYIRNRMGETVQPAEDDEQIITQAFAMFVHQIYGAINEAGANPDEAKLAETLDENIRSFTWVLIGIESNE
jgi:hypothetical protein